MADTHDSDSEPTGFPLSVDLSPYVGAPARCRVWVRTRARKVKWLANRVRRAARLKGPLLLRAGDCLLPPGEPLRVIRPDDTLSVARVEHKWQRPFSIHENEAAPTEPAAAVESTSPATLSTLEQPLEKRAQPAKQKHIAIEPSVTEQPSVKPSLKRQKSPTTEQTSEEPMLLDHDALSRVKQRALALLHQVTGDDVEQDVVDAPKKKRRRVRRRRPCRDVNLDSIEADVEARSIENDSELQVPKSNQEYQDESIEERDVPCNGVQSGSTLQSHTQQSVVPTLAPAVSLPMTSVSAVQSPTILTYPSPSVLVRNLTPPRAPRVVRALTAELPKMDAALVSTN